MVAPGKAEAALHAVGIAPELFAASRATGLVAEDRDLYRRVLERLSRGERPARGWLAKTADTKTLAERLERLAGADLIGLDSDGEVTLAYPFSAHPSRQRIDTADGRRLWACCAIDALGIPAMLGVDATVVARELGGEAEIRVRVGPTGDPSPDPEDAIVLAAVAGSGGGTTACCACPFINFFPSSASADAYQAVHPELSGIQLTMQEAAAAGRLLFGGLFEHLSA